MGSGGCCMFPDDPLSGGGNPNDSDSDGNVSGLNMLDDGREGSSTLLASPGAGDPVPVYSGTANGPDVALLYKLVSIPNQWK